MRLGLKIFFNKKFMEKKLYTEQEILDLLEKDIEENAEILRKELLQIKKEKENNENNIITFA